MADWQLEYDGWSETWHRPADAGFDRVAVGGRSFAVDRDDLSALRPRTGRGCGVCRGVLPQAFAHCFACGAALQDAAAPGEPCQSAPNAGRPKADLPPLTLAGPPAQPERFALPSVGRQFAFAVAGQPARLFAIDRDGGWVHAFDRRQSSWTRLFGAGGNRLPERSWSVAAAPAGIVIPAEGRLSVIDLTRGPLPQQANTALPAGDACVGGACILLNEAMVPVVRGGALHLARRRMLRGTEWAFEPVRGAPPWPGDAMLPQLALSAPMATETGVSWAGEHGYAFVTLGDDGVAGPPAWRGWGGGFTPLLAHRPYADPDGGVWQFGSAPRPNKRRTYRFERVAASSPAGEDVSSAVLASGVLACRLLTLRHKAWVEDSPYDRELPGRTDDDFLIPVQALDPARCVLLTASERFAEFAELGPDGISPPLLAGLRFYDGQALHDLGVPVNLQSLAQIAAFVFDGRLYVYDALENECWRWQLRPAP